MVLLVLLMLLLMLILSLSLVLHSYPSKKPSTFFELAKKTLVIREMGSICHHLRVG